MIYTHVVNRGGKGIISPLDRSMVVMELGLRIMKLLNQGKCGGGGWVLCRSFPIAVDNH